jgi:hypothetical protein
MYIKVKIKSSLCLTKHHAMKMYGGMETLVGGEWSAHSPSALPQGKEPLVPIEWEAGWVPEAVWAIWWSENSWPYWDSNSKLLVTPPIASRYTDCITAAPCISVY